MAASHRTKGGVGVSHVYRVVDAAAAQVVVVVVVMMVVPAMEQQEGEVVAEGLTASMCKL